VPRHAPLLSGRSLNAYLACGVRNCHETTSLDEGREKLSKGMQVLIREGTASQDLAALVPLINEFTSPFLGFCTDDRNPLDIYEEGHIDHLVRRAIALGAPAAAVYRTASWSAARGFGLRDRGLVAPGYLADILLLDDLAARTSCIRAWPHGHNGRRMPNLFAITDNGSGRSGSGPPTWARLNSIYIQFCGSWPARLNHMRGEEDGVWQRSSHRFTAIP
jgi:hypothetical protein